MAAPSGTVTMLFSDIEGSTRLLQRLGPQYPDVLEDHRQIVRKAYADRGGHEEGTEGDSFFVLFERASDGLAAALDAQRALYMHDWPTDANLRVRMGLHTGEVIQAGGGYVGLAIHEGARIGAAGHGGQIVLSNITRELAGAAPDGASYRDLGEHWLKDLANPQHLFQLQHPELPTEFAPIRSHGSIPHNLPAQTTSLIGRERETEEVALLLRDHRVVTITGAGGAGKSRLAVSVAAEVMSTFGDGVWLVELAPHVEAAAVADALGAAIGLAPGSALEDIESFLKGRTSLVILDNCEHLIDPAAEVAHVLLRTCPDVKIVTTTREPLGLPGEVSWRLPSLSMPKMDVQPTADELASYEAVQLFCRRAQEADPRFQLNDSNAAAVMGICRQLDGIPLALELAAARVSTLGVDQLASRLDQRFRLLTGGSRVGLARQRTLQSTVDWSYDLLEDKEKLLLRRLGVFVGGWMLDAAIAVCTDEGLDDFDLIDLLAQLASKSLVVTEDTDAGVRYRFLETVRQYALDRLLEANELEGARDRHSAWCGNFAEAAWSALLRGESDRVVMDPLEAELENIRTAIDWTIERDPIAAEAIVGACYVLWVTRERGLEGRRRLRQVIGAAPAGARFARFRALAMGGFIREGTVSPEQVDAWIEEAREILPQLDDPPNWAVSALDALLAFQAFRRGDSEGALEIGIGALHRATNINESPFDLLGAHYDVFLLSQGVQRYDLARASSDAMAEIAQRCGWRIPACRATLGRAFLEFNATDGADVDARCDEAIRAAREADDPYAIAWGLQVKGLVALREERFAECVDYLEEAAAVARRHGMLAMLATALQNVGWARYLNGDLEGGLKRTEEGLVLHRQTAASPETLCGCMHSVGEIARVAGDTDKARRTLIGALHVGLQHGDSARMGTSIASCFEALGGLAAAAGRGRLAAFAFGVADANWPAYVAHHPYPAELAVFARDVALAREVAGDDFEAAFEEGKTIDLREALDRIERELS